MVRSIMVGRGLAVRQSRTAAAAICSATPAASFPSLAAQRTFRCHGASVDFCRSIGGSPFLGVRPFSDVGKAAEQEEELPLNEEEAAASMAAEAVEATSKEAEATPAGKTKEEELESQIKDLKDQLLRSLAEQENTRRIAKRDVDAAKSYAVTSMAKSLLDTSDNLARALESVPPEYRTDSENHPVLATLYEGIKMTDDGLTKAFAKNGLTKFGEPGEKFDPNLHEALYEYADQEKEVGTVGQVMKVGFMLNKRVVRPAEVGVVKNA